MNKYISSKKIKINLIKSQRETIDFWLRKCCTIYNTALQERIYYYQSTKKYLSLYEQKKELVDIKEYDKAFKDVPNKSLQEIIFRIDKTFKAFFNGFGFPKYKKHLDTIEFVKTDVRIIDGKLYLPKIKTFIKTTESVESDWTSVQLKKQYDNYYLIFRYLKEIKVEYKNDNILGVDLGLKTLYTDSNQNSCDRLSQKLIKKYNKRKNILNQSLSVKVKGSNQFRKVKKHINKSYERLNNTKLDYLHKCSLILLKNEEGVINVGDIKIQKIVDSLIKNEFYTSSNKGTVKSFYMTSLGIFKNILKYKGIKYNKHINFVNERNTSKTCSCCGWINNKLKLEDRVFVCKECKNSIDRDYNSAINMKWLGSSSSMINNRTCSTTH